MPASCRCWLMRIRAGAAPSTSAVPSRRSSRSALAAYTPRYTRYDLSTVGVDIVLHCCSAYRAMNAAAFATYEAIRRDGTQKNVVDRMQTRADLYKYLDYHAYEAKLDALFAEGKGT